MHELPEVEVSRLGISPHMLKQTVKQVRVHQTQLRWPVPDDVYQLEGKVINEISRRAKYLMISVDSGSVILPLGMSGNLRVALMSAITESISLIVLFNFSSSSFSSLRVSSMCCGITARRVSLILSSSSGLRKNSKSLSMTDTASR